MVDMHNSKIEVISNTYTAMAMYTFKNNNFSF